VRAAGRDPPRIRTPSDRRRGERGYVVRGANGGALCDQPDAEKQHHIGAPKLSAGDVRHDARLLPLPRTRPLCAGRPSVGSRAILLLLDAGIAA
jgi:hypothetical protein